MQDRDEGLSLLVRLSLVNWEPERDRFWMLPLVQEYARAELEQADFRDDMRKHWLAWARDFALRYGTDLEIHVQNAPTFAQEYPNLHLVFRWCTEREQWQNVVALADNIWFYPYLAGLVEEAKEIAEIGIRAARYRWDLSREARFYERSRTCSLGAGDMFSKGSETSNRLRSLRSSYKINVNWACPRSAGAIA
jgi:hypothetical protein